VEEVGLIDRGLKKSGLSRRGLTGRARIGTAGALLAGLQTLDATPGRKKDSGSSSTSSGISRRRSAVCGLRERKLLLIDFNYSLI